jgi:hypothetical protein
MIPHKNENLKSRNQINVSPCRYHNLLLEFTLKNRPQSQPVKHKGPRNCLALTLSVLLMSCNNPILINLPSHSLGHSVSSSPTICSISNVY